VSDYLANLATRYLNQAPSIRPEPVAIFQPSIPSRQVQPEPLLEESVEVEGQAEPRKPAPAVRSRTARPRPNAGEPERPPIAPRLLDAVTEEFDEGRVEPIRAEPSRAQPTVVEADAVPAAAEIVIAERTTAEQPRAKTSSGESTRFEGGETAKAGEKRHDQVDVVPKPVVRADVDRAAEGERRSDRSGQRSQPAQATRVDDVELIAPSAPTDHTDRVEARTSIPQRRPTSSLARPAPDDAPPATTLLPERITAVTPAHVERLVDSMTLPQPGVERQALLKRGKEIESELPSVVEISIDRIDIRAVPPPPPPTMPRQDRLVRPPMSLEDYLRRRSGSGRR
jgi:hypothetical protein